MVLSESPGDPHNWNSLRNYADLHQKRIEDHPLVTKEESTLTLEIAPQPQALYDQVVMEGQIVCRNGLHLSVHKEGQIDRTSSRRVRMLVYSYNAHFPGGNNVLRYDNQHRKEPPVYHRHVFDPETGIQVAFRTMTRIEFPVMHQVLDELMERFPIEDPVK